MVRRGRLVPIDAEIALRLEQAHQWYGSEEYRELKELRLRALRSDAVFMEGLMDGFR